MATDAGLNKRTSSCSGHQFRVWRRRSTPMLVLEYLWHSQHHTRRQVKADTKAKVLAAAPTRDTGAYDLFLKGEYEERQAEGTESVDFFDRAETFYRKALAREPSFALAYARLANNRLNRHWFSNRLAPAQLEEVRSDIERAFAIAPDLQRHLRRRGAGRFAGGRRVVRFALQRFPSRRNWRLRRNSAANFSRRKIRFGRSDARLNSAGIVICRKVCCTP